MAHCIAHKLFVQKCQVSLFWWWPNGCFPNKLGMCKRPISPTCGVVCTIIYIAQCMPGREKVGLYFDRGIIWFVGNGELQIITAYTKAATATEKLFSLSLEMWKPVCFEVIFCCSVSFLCGCLSGYVLDFYTSSNIATDLPSTGTV